MADRAPSFRFRPGLVVQALSRHHVDYVMIGALAGRLAGFPRLTAAIDITPSRERANLERLAAALRELDAKVFTQELPDGLPFDCSAAMLLLAEVWNLITIAGRVDLLFNPAGGHGYEQLLADSIEYPAYETMVRAASLPALLKMKEAANRPKDQEDAKVIRAMLDADARRG